MKEYTIIYKNGKTLKVEANYIARTANGWQMATNNGLTMLKPDHIETIIESEVF